MLRTRDFVLVLTVIGFLFVSVGATFLKLSVESKEVFSEINFVETELGEIKAELPESKTISREERLESMRQKIAEEQEKNVEISLALGEDEIGEDSEENYETEIEDEEIVLISPKHCDNYVEYKGVWSPYGISFDVAEGMRIVYREIISQLELDLTATSGTELPSEIVREIFMELPAFPITTSVSSCLSSNVIGIANDGSLIKNSESSLYSIFGTETLIGYALDGYPIFGLSAEETNECGWGLINGQYGYYLSSNRETILNCFVGTPISTSFLY